MEKLSKDIIEIKKLKEQITKDMIILEERIKKSNLLKNKIPLLKEKLEEKIVEIEKIKKEIVDINKSDEKVMMNIGGENLEDIKDAIKILDEIDSLEIKKASKERELNTLIGSYTLEEIETKAREYAKENIEISENINELNNKLETILEGIIAANKEIGGINSKIYQIESSTRELIEIQEEISIEEKEKKEMEDKINALNMAYDTIEKISKDIQNNFAPKLIRKIEDMVGKATNEKYSEIKITPNMEVLVLDKINNKLVNINELSNGTIDLIYFGLRLAIIKSITENNKLPLFLDDPFIQYDLKRFENTIEVLKNEKRQIIIFTCHKREEDIIKNKFQKLNIIKI